MDTSTPEERRRIEELMDLTDVLDEFSGAMEDRLRKKYDKGYRGWNCEKEESKDLPGGLSWLSGRNNFINGLFRSVEKGNWADAANWAMFIWNLDRESNSLLSETKEAR